MHTDQKVKSTQELYQGASTLNEMMLFNSNPTLNPTTQNKSESCETQFKHYYVDTILTKKEVK